MWFVDKIVEYLSDITTAFNDAMWEVHGWIWPFWYLQYPLYALYEAFWYLTYYFEQFNGWLEWASGRIEKIITTWDVWATFVPWFTAATNAWEWVKVAWTNVYMIVDTWWESTWGNILAWLQDWHTWLTERIDWLRDMVDVIKAELTSRLNTLSTQWDYFWTVLYPQSVSFSALATWWNSQLLELQGLISSQLQAYEPFWAGWQELKSQVVEFFTDPEEWVYKRLDNFFERFW